jgi:hypothetical protein
MWARKPGDHSRTMPLTDVRIGLTIRVNTGELRDTSAC